MGVTGVFRQGEAIISLHQIAQGWHLSIAKGDCVVAGSFGLAVRVYEDVQCCFKDRRYPTPDRASELYRFRYGLLLLFPMS